MAAARLAYVERLAAVVASAIMAGDVPRALEVVGEIARTAAAGAGPTGAARGLERAGGA